MIHTIQLLLWNLVHYYACRVQQTRPADEVNINALGYYYIIHVCNRLRIVSIRNKRI